MRGTVPIAGAGIVPMWEGRGYAWTWFKGDLSMSEWGQVTKRISDWLDQDDYRRVELLVYDRDKRAKRWATRLGFKFESHNPKIMPDGEDGCTFVRFNGGHESQKVT